ncbi:aminoglycoside phosphotransferase family protein [Herbidospora daliensis]|uniref:aminoglycoside phosphotransferase family protein n=1 Tax=Herbidospora daliensis TaxID=295585 RepID=UPI000785A3D1|nr:aminoglycoside phosphotransferase family protein [Herbidospora daliensis]
MRQASAVVTCGDRTHGRYGPAEMPSPWWNDVGPVTTWLSEAVGAPVVVLRLLDVEGGAMMRDGHATYHAEALEEPPAYLAPNLRTDLLPNLRAGLPPNLQAGFPADERREKPVPPVPVGLPDVGTREHPSGLPAELWDDEPLRASWATRDGLRAALDWALGITGPSEIRQVKTWNLAGLFHLPGANAWLKTTPPFAAPEASVIAALAEVDPTLVPKVLGADPGRGWTLLEHIPGQDCWKAAPDLVTDTVTRFARAQRELGIRMSGAIGAEPALPGLIDRRSVLAATGRLPRVPGSDELLERVPALEEELAACGVPYTLVHGDFHPGNWRAAPTGPAVVLDFADAHLGHPAADGIRLREWTGDAEAWVAAWSLPGADPRRALEVAAPLAMLGQAVRYQEFLDGIEPSERRYHAGDPEEALVEAVRALRRLRPA